MRPYCRNSALIWLGWLVRRLGHHLLGRHTRGGRQLTEILKRQIGILALDLTDLGPMKTGL